MKLIKPSKQPPNGLRILFADDEESLQDVMSMEIPRMGHSVTVCPNGEMAVRESQENDYDCLIVDLDMPGMNGIDVIRHIKGHSPETEAIVLTGKESIETRGIVSVNTDPFPGPEL